MCFDFVLHILFETFLIVRRIQRDIVINEKMYSCKVPVIFIGFQWNLNFLNRLSKKSEISNFFKIRPMGAELFHTNGQMEDLTQLKHIEYKMCDFSLQRFF